MAMNKHCLVKNNDMAGAVNERCRRLRKKTQHHTLMIGVVADIIAEMVIVPVRTALS